MPRPPLLAAALCALLLPPASAQEATWPGWRGPARDGVADGAAWPEELGDDSLEQVWRIELGRSYSGPVIADGMVFTTATVEDTQERVYAFDLATGEKRWEAGWEGFVRVPFFARKNGSWIRSTPAFSDGKLYVAGMRDQLVCLDAASGEIAWKRDFVEELDAKVPDFGFVCSPLVDGDSLYVQAGGSVLALDKGTGRTLWRALEDGGGMNGSAFSSPVVAEIGGVRQLVVQTRTTLAGLALGDGAELWQQEIEAFRGMNILPPTVAGDQVYTSAYGGKSQLFRIANGGEGWSVEEVWSSKPEAYMSSPLLIGGALYLHLRNRRFACLDWETGETQWETDERFGEYWSSVTDGERILALDQKGDLRLIEASPEGFVPLGSLSLADDSWAHLAPAGEYLAIRELGALALYRWR